MNYIHGFWGPQLYDEIFQLGYDSHLTIEIGVGFQFPSQVHDNIVDWEVKDPVVASFARHRV